MSMHIIVDPTMTQVPTSVFPPIVTATDDAPVILNLPLEEDNFVVEQHPADDPVLLDIPTDDFAASDDSNSPVLVAQNTNQQAPVFVEGMRPIRIPVAAQNKEQTVNDTPLLSSRLPRVHLQLSELSWSALGSFAVIGTFVRKSGAKIGKKSEDHFCFDIF